MLQLQKNLFFSTPARLKFLKTDNYESLLIKRIVQKFALCNFKIDFELTINNKLAIKTRGKDKNSNKQLENRARDFLLGPNFRKSQSLSMNPQITLDLKVFGDPNFSSL